MVEIYAGIDIMLIEVSGTILALLIVGLVLILINDLEDMCSGYYEWEHECDVAT